MTSRPRRLSIVMFSILSLNICLSVLSISLLLFIVMLSMIICCLNVCVVKDDMMWVVLATGDGVGDGDGGNKPLLLLLSGDVPVGLIVDVVLRHRSLKLIFLWYLMFYSYFTVIFGEVGYSAVVSVVFNINGNPSNNNPSTNTSSSLLTEYVFPP